MHLLRHMATFGVLWVYGKRGSEPARKPLLLPMPVGRQGRGDFEDAPHPCTAASRRASRPGAWPDESTTTRLRYGYVSSCKTVRAKGADVLPGLSVPAAAAIYEHLKYAGYVVPAKGSRRAKSSTSGRVRLVPVTTGGDYDMMQKNLFDPLLHIRHHVSFLSQWIVWLTAHADIREVPETCRTDGAGRSVACATSSISN